MNEISNQVGYPFQLFNEEAFSKEWVIDEMSEAYMEITKWYSDDYPVINTGIIASKSIDLFKLGVFGRICTLDEEYLSFDFNSEANHVVQSIYENTNYDLEATIKLWDQFEFQRLGFLGFGVNPEEGDAFKKDISMALNLAHIFYVDGNIDYHALHWFANHAKSKGEDDIVAPFSEEGIQRVFRNIPIVRVW